MYCTEVFVYKSFQICLMIYYYIRANNNKHAQAIASVSSTIGAGPIG